jgi:hypothetical protein
MRGTAGSLNVVAAARRLALDRGTGEAVAALAAAGVPSILLKGAAIRHWLYDAGSPRTYCDCDLLVRAQDFSTAEGVLVRLGFLREFSDEAVVRSRIVPAHTWLRPADHTRVDLHRSLEGVRDAGTLWARLHSDGVTLVVGGADVLIPDRRGIALIVALHAAKHGTTSEQPLQDLEQAVGRFDVSVWKGAASLVRALDAESAFGAGMRLLASGRELADELGIADQPPVASLLAAEAAPGPAIRLEQFAHIAGWRGKAAFVVRTFFPAPSYMRLFWPLARHSATGLALAYVLRPFGLARDAFPAWQAWRRARRKASIDGRRDS